MDPHEAGDARLTVIGTHDLGWVSVINRVVVAIHDLKYAIVAEDNTLRQRDGRRFVVVRDLDGLGRVEALELRVGWVSKCSMNTS